MVITPCEKCTIRTYVSLSIPLHPIPSIIIFIRTLFHFYFLPFLLQIVSNTTSLTKKNHTYLMLKTNLFIL